MARIFGREYTADELRRHVGDISQVAGTRAYRIQGGAADGVRGIDVYTGSGLRFTVLPGRGLDISHASYKGIPLAWISPAGEVSAHAYEPAGFGWLRTFGGGLLTTCGMSHILDPATEDGVDYGQHGRASTLIAENVSTDGRWDGDEYKLRVTGTTRETALGSEQFELVRTISTRLGATSLKIEDTVTNIAHRPQTHMYLHHMNIGHPVAGPDTELVASIHGLRVRPGFEQDAANDFRHFAEPELDYPPRVFEHRPVPDADGYAYAALINESLASGSLAISFRYRVDSFPFLNQWKLLDRGDYVVGIEPNNAGILDRLDARKAGDLRILDPGQAVSYETEIGVLDGRAEIDEFRARVARVMAEIDEVIDAHGGWPVAFQAAGA